MTGPSDDAIAQAQEQVGRARASRDAAAIASALERYATATLEQGDLPAAAAALEEAAGHWAAAGGTESQANCLLLAASSYRLAADHDAGSRVVGAGLQLELPARLRRAFDLERCEQQLARGDAEGAAAGFARFLDDHAAGLERPAVAHVHQRRAAAFVAGERFAPAADELLKAAAIFRERDAPVEEEACTVAAAAVLSEVDPAAAEALLPTLAGRVPAEGGAAARRGLVGGTIALKAGQPQPALTRFDDARRGALDATDAQSYLSAAVGASRAAEAMGRNDVAYARLATAWGTLSDLLGRDLADRRVTPLLQALKERLGADSFATAKAEYEAARRDRQDST